MKKRSRNPKRPVKKFKVPANLRDAAKAFVQLTRDQGTIELGSGVLLTRAQIALDCKCLCTIAGLIEGPATLTAGATGDYTFTVGPIGGNPACFDCVHTDTNFSVTKFGTITKIDKSNFQMKADPMAKLGQKIQLSATPVGSCQCLDKGVKVKKNCPGVLEQANVLVVAP